MGKNEGHPTTWCDGWVDPTQPNRSLLRIENGLHQGPAGLLPLLIFQQYPSYPALEAARI